MKCFFVYLLQDDHGLKRKITFLKQVLAVQNEVSVYEIRVSLFKRENECFLLFAFLKNPFHLFYSLFFIVSYFRMYGTMSFTTINQLLQIPYSLLKNSLTFQQIDNFC